MEKERPGRSILKTITWRVVASLTTVLVAYLVTRRLTVAISIGGIDMVVKTLIYYLHERVWSKSRFGYVTERDTD